MNQSCLNFGQKLNVKGKRVIEIGSLDVNGSLQPLLKAQEPLEYIGIDIKAGRGVDIVLDAEDVMKFGKNSFDVVVSTELLEHTYNWRKVISNIKNICKPDGIILITTRSKGANYHSYPHDFWRYELEDIERIFSDCEITDLEKDPELPGVFLKAIKPKNFKENNLSQYKLYSIISNKRVLEIKPEDYKTLYFAYTIVKRMYRSIRLKKRIKRLLIMFAKR